MSLVVVLCGKDYQFWFSDGLTIEPLNEGFRICSKHVSKIVRHPDQKILFGWAGDRYDAEKVIELYLSQNKTTTIDSLVHEFSGTCDRINKESKKFSIKNKQIHANTGFIIGGYLECKSFLNIILPNGAVIYKNQIAIIGHDSQMAYDLLLQFINHQEMDYIEAYKIISNIFDEIATKSKYTNNELSSFLLTPEAVTEISDIRT